MVVGVVLGVDIGGGAMVNGASGWCKVDIGGGAMINGACGW